MVVRGTHNKSQVIEEPYEVKVSRTVLKTNGIGDNLVEFNPVELEETGTLAKNEIIEVITTIAVYKFSIQE